MKGKTAGKPHAKKKPAVGVKSSSLRRKGRTAAGGRKANPRTGAAGSKAARHAISGSERKWRGILKSAPLGMHLYELMDDGRLIFVDYNPAADRILGIDNSKFLGMTLEEAFPSNVGTVVPETYRRVAKGAEPVTLDQYAYQDDKIAGVFEVFFFQAAPGFAGSLFHDVSEKRKLEEELRKGVENWRQTFDSVPDLILILDDQHRVVRANKAFLDLAGREPRELLGRRCYEVVHHSSEPHGLCPHALTLKDGKEHTQEVFEPALNRHFLVTTSPMPGFAGQTRASVHVMRDITAQKQAATELEKHRERLEELVEARTAENRRMIHELKKEVDERGRVQKELAEANAALTSFFSTTHMQIAYLDRDFNFIQVNEAYARGAGHPVEYFIGKNHFGLYPHEENQRIFQKVVETGEPFIVYAKPFEYPDRPELGVTYWDWTLFPIKGPLGQVEAVILYLLDVTERVRARLAEQEAERKLEEQRARAIHADHLRSLGEMAAAIAHELNQPLSGVRGQAEHILIGMERGWELTPEDLGTKARLIVEQADRMGHVIEHTRQFAKGVDSDELMPVQVNEVIVSGLGMIGAQLKARGLTLITELAPDLPHVIANPFSIEEVVINLVSNSRDALLQAKAQGGDPGPIRITTSLDEALNTPYVKIQVTDQGPGIPQEIVDRIFEPFFTTKEVEKGTGLGLAICESLIAGFGGDISVESKEGEGTTVTVLLPAMPAATGKQP